MLGRGLATDLRFCERLTLRNMAGLVRYALLRLRYRNFRVGLFFVDRGADIRIGPRAQIQLGNRVRMMRDFTGSWHGQVTIGDDAFFNRGCHIAVHKALRIGNNCIFGEMVSIHDENHVVERGDRVFSERGHVSAPITIGNNVWVGAKATILPGVVIGDNAVIGAGAVVTRDVPAYAVAVGIPARVIREY